MKRILLYCFNLGLIVFALTNCSKDDNESFVAQKIEITKASLDQTSIGTEVGFYEFDFTGTIDISSGENKFWNLQQNVSLTGAYPDIRLVNPKTSTNFNDANYIRSRVFYIIGKEVSATEYFYLADDKIYAKGLTIDAQVISNNGVTITIPKQEVLYDVLRVAYYLPISYDGQLKQIPQYSRTINATISGISALGIPDGTPVSYKVTYNDKYQVISWGAVKLYENENPANVLLVKNESSAVETIYINGVKATQAQLSPLGLTQDMATNTVDYTFKNQSYLGYVAAFGYANNAITYLVSIQTVR
jgi:hypothetical protein